MSVTIDGSLGIDMIQDNTVATAKLQAGAVTPAKTQVGALPSMIRLNTANGYGSTNTMIRRFTNTDVSQGSDITYADSATLGATFTINTNGIYAISYADDFSAASNMGLSVNSNQLTTSITTITQLNRIIYANATTAANPQEVSATMYLSAGDVIRAHTGGVSTGASVSAKFIITRVG